MLLNASGVQQTLYRVYNIYTKFQICTVSVNIVSFCTTCFTTMFILHLQPLTYNWLFGTNVTQLCDTKGQFGSKLQTNRVPLQHEKRYSHRSLEKADFFSLLIQAFLFQIEKNLIPNIKESPDFHQSAGPYGIPIYMSTEKNQYRIMWLPLLLLFIKLL